MELRHLRYFIAVAEERHFGNAAKRLHIAQPPLSRQIQALERELGFELLDRTRRRVEVTDAGLVFLAHARRVFEALDFGIRETRRANNGESGRIVVGYPSSLAYSGLTGLLRAFRERYPGVDMALRELPPSEQIEALKAGTLDVGFIRAPFDDAALDAETVRREVLAVAMPSEHRLASRARVRLSSLARDPFVFFPRHRGPAFFDQLMWLCRQAGFVPRIVQEAPQLDLVSLVAAGFGVAILPASMKNALREGVVLRPIVGSPRADLLIAWRKDNHAPIVQAFIQSVRRVGLDKA